jgi:hypothetical protein
MEAARGRALEMLLTLQKAVEDLEAKLGIYVWWKPDEPEWISTQELITMCKYHRAIDHLEGLVVLSKLANMHQSGTGIFLLFFLFLLLDVDIFPRI